MRRFFLCILLIFTMMGAMLPSQAQAQRIDRKALVRRHNPEVKSTNPYIINKVCRDGFTLADGQNTFHTDVTGLQTFGGDNVWPLAVGLNLPDTATLTNLDAKHDRWSGKIDSRFQYNGQRFHVETVMHQRTVATRISSDSLIEVVFRSHEIAGKYAKESLGNDLTVSLRPKGQKERYVVQAFRYGKGVHVKKTDDGVIIRCKKGPLELLFCPVITMPHSDFFVNIDALPYTEYALSVAANWNAFWMDCGLADFSATKSPEAQLAEKRMVDALYGFAVNSFPDWWTGTPLALYGFPGQLAQTINATRARRENLASRPEFIATAENILRAYTHPYIVEKQYLTEKDVEMGEVMVVNAYAPIIKEAVEQLDSLSVPYLDASALRELAEKWLEVSTDTVSDSSVAEQLLKFPIYRLPPLLETLSMPLSYENEKLLLLSIAARNFPKDWQVKIENIVPLTGEKYIDSNPKTEK